METVKTRLESGNWKEFRVLVPTAVYEKLEAEAMKDMRKPGNHTAWLLGERFNKKAKD